MKGKKPPPPHLTARLFRRMQVLLDQRRQVAGRRTGPAGIAAAEPQPPLSGLAAAFFGSQRLPTCHRLNPTMAAITATWKML
ncbi:MAG: hypothetical protein WDN06_05010 [Asticcacaulis sp.]